MNKNIKLSVIALGAMLLTPALVKSNEKVALAEETEVEYVAKDEDGDGYTSIYDAVISGASSITLLKDITISTPIDTYGGNMKTFDFNGHVITCSTDFTSYLGATAAFYIDSGYIFDTFTFLDSSTSGTGGITCLDGSNAFCYHIKYRNADVVFESGTYKGQQSVVYVELGQATIKGGTFSNTPVSEEQGNTFFLNCYDANFANGSAKIYVKGGTFIDYDPSTQAADAGSYIPDGYVVSKVVEEDGTVKYATKALPVEMNDKYYESLQDAVNEAKNGETITLQKDAATNGVIKGNGVQAKSGSNFVLDLNGLTYEVAQGMVGSSGSETNGFHLLRDSNITIKNGTLTKSINYINGSMLIQNYSNLTLDNVILQGTSNVRYVLSNNYGNIVLKNGTELNATDGNYAFDVYYWAPYYKEGVTLTIADDTVKVVGKVGYASSDNTEDAYNKLNLIMPAGYELTLDNGLVLVASEDGKTQKVTTSDVVAAKEFAVLWKNVRNSEGGLCAIVGTSAMDDLLTKFDKLSATSKEYLESVQDADGVTVAYSVNYFKTLQQTKASTSTEPGIKTTLLNTSSESNNAAMIVLFAMLGIAGVVSYYYIEKSKVNN